MAVPVVVLQQIKAPAGKVFGFIANLELHPRIARFCESVHYTSERRESVGTTFHQVQKSGRECDSEITVWEPPARIVWQNFYKGSRKPTQVVTYLLEKEGGITHLLHIVESEAYENLALHREGTADNVEEMRRIKKILEG
ncbi:MAG: hypothetical protein HYY21_10175 [Candidatus Tectomicrobia bacterium]|nr:hypothetical protein [Candidatus Tectomicrobia bacterium]